MGYRKLLAIVTASTVIAFSQGVPADAERVSVPRVLNRVEVEYSDRARRAELSGMVAVNLDVGLDGKAHNVRIRINSLDPELDRKVIEAVKKWTFTLGMKGETPVIVRTTIEVQFQLLHRTNFKRVAKIYESAAKKQNADAQFTVAAIYYRGGDYEAAREWMEKAAAQGLSQAEYGLGVMCERGQGGPRDVVAAVDWYRKAAGHTNEDEGIMWMPDGKPQRCDPDRSFCAPATGNQK